MKTIGIFGGSFALEVGSAGYVQAFFDCVEKYVVVGSTDVKWKLITDRLYRRYVALDDLPMTESLMREVKEMFANIKVSDANLVALNATHGYDTDSLAEFFALIFKQFSFCKEAAEDFFKKWKKYPAVRIVISDMPDLVNDKVRKLEEYDQLTGEPFWKR
jgi:hypothetical protein